MNASRTATRTGPGRADRGDHRHRPAPAGHARARPGLSLRAVAREMGMVSSAIYRYFPSRDDLLTALIIDGYNAVGEAVEKRRRGLPARGPHRPVAGRSATPYATGRWPTRTSTRCCTARRCPATARRRTRSAPAIRDPSSTAGSSPTPTGRGPRPRRTSARRRRPRSARTRRACAQIMPEVPDDVIARGRDRLDGPVRLGQLRAVRPVQEHDPRPGRGLRPLRALPGPLPRPSRLTGPAIRGFRVLLYGLFLHDKVRFRRDLTLLSA